jgi:hypothetical protein
MGPLSYMRSVVEQNFVMLHIPVYDVKFVWEKRK